MSRGEYAATIDECRMGKELLTSCSKERHKDEWYIDLMERFQRSWPRVGLPGSVRERVGATARGDETVCPVEKGKRMLDFNYL